MDAQEAKFFAALLIAACIIGVILVFFIITIVRYHRRHVALYREKIAAEINIAEKERSRIAADLHDQLGPILSTVKLQASALEPNVETEKCIIEKLKDNIDVIISDIRTISNNLRPGALARYGFYKAVKAFTDSINDTCSIKVLFAYTGSEWLMGAETEVHLFRIIQELVNNSLKHSTADAIILAIRRRATNLELTVSDNGKGFDINEAAYKSKGSGISSIINRVELLKGKLECSSDAVGGTRVKVTIPITYEHGKDKSCYSR